MGCKYFIALYCRCSGYLQSPGPDTLDSPVIRKRRKVTEGPVTSHKSHCYALVSHTLGFFCVSVSKSKVINFIQVVYDVSPLQMSSLSDCESQVSLQLANLLFCPWDLYNFSHKMKQSHLFRPNFIPCRMSYVPSSPPPLQ